MTPLDFQPGSVFSDGAGDFALGSTRGVEVIGRLVQLSLQVLPCDCVAVLVYGEQGDPWLHAQPPVEGDLAHRLLSQVDAGTEPGTVLALAGNGIRLADGRPLEWARLQPLRGPGGTLIGVLAAIAGYNAPMDAGSGLVLSQLVGVFEDELNLMRIGVRDHLTGLYNRRFFDEMANREWRRAKRDTLPVSVLVADIDYFKTFNDSYGHVEGDRVLASVARCLARTFRRAADLLARYGGEEFAAILPQTDSDGGRRAAERLCAAVAALQIPHTGSPLGYVTISVGVSTAGTELPDETDLSGFTKAADEALYRAKRNGRARVEVAGI